MTLVPGTSIDPAVLVGERWFAAKERTVVSVEVEDRFSIGTAGLAILRVQLSGGPTVRYTMPERDTPSAWSGLADLATRGGAVRGEAGGTLAGERLSRPGHTARPDRSAPGADDTVRPLGIDQSHTSMVLDEDRLLKLYRRLEPGPNPEVELASVLPATLVPAFIGAIRYVAKPASGTGQGTDVAIVQRFVPGAVDEFERLADRLAAWLRAGSPAPGLAEVLADVGPVGRTVAALHAALRGLRGPALRARAASAADIERWSRRASRALPAVFRAIERVDPDLAADIRARRDDIELALRPITDAAPGMLISRIHGDLHLGQLVRDGERLLVVDLEGDPTRSVRERRRRDTPLRDVASMLRSFDHIARSAIRRSGIGDAPPAADEWLHAARTGFLDAYGEELRARGAEPDLDPRLLHALEVEKELGEFVYAATYLPAWRYAPAGGLRWLLRRAAVPSVAG